MAKKKGSVQTQDSIILHIYVHNEVPENFKRLHSRWKSEQEDINRTTQNYFLIHLLNLAAEELKFNIKWKVKNFEVA